MLAPAQAVMWGRSLARAANVVSRGDARRGFKALSGQFYVPHAHKVEKGGEDAGFVSSCDRCFGVADGVGGWAEMGVDAGLYSTALMEGVHGSISAALEDGSDCRPPWDSLQEGFDSMDKDVRGSCTACVVSVKRDQLRAANLGDSGFAVMRFARPGDDKSSSDSDAHVGPPDPLTALLHKPSSCVFMSKPQTFSFNFPYQMGSGSNHTPADADRYDFTVQPGDVIVTGTDGLWDNLFLSNISALLQDTDWVALAERGAALLAAEADGASSIGRATVTEERQELTAMIQRHAEAIVTSAVHVAWDDGTRHTPFSVEALRWGHRFPPAGKPDDTYVIVSLVVAEPGDDMFYV